MLTSKLPLVEILLYLASPMNVATTVKVSLLSGVYSITAIQSFSSVTTYFTPLILNTTSPVTLSPNTAPIIKGLPTSRGEVA